MLLKLIKFDFKRTRRYCIPLLALVLIATVAACLCGSVVSKTVGMGEAPDNEWSFLANMTMFFSAVGFFFAMLLIVISASLISLMICIEFYRSLVSDEGYLTFTLPVKTSETILSKLINGIIWILISLAAVALSAVLICGSIVLFGGLAAENVLDIITSIFYFENALDATLTVINVAASAVSGLLLTFTAIFLGSVIAKKNKLLAAVGCVLGCRFIYNMVTGIAALVLDVIIYGMLKPVNMDTAMLSSVVMNLVSAVISVSMSIALFFILKYMLDKKLNLS